jgi:hypothetical protein
LSRATLSQRLASHGKDSAQTACTYLQWFGWQARQGCETASHAVSSRFNAWFTWPDHVDLGNPVQEAVLFIKDALDGRRHVHPRGGEVARREHLRQLNWMWPIVRVVLVLQLLLCFFERPPWCALAEDRDGMRAPCEDRSRFPVFGLPYLHRWAALGIDYVLLSAICAEFACAHRVQ